MYDTHVSGAVVRLQQMRAEETIVRNLAAPFGLSLHKTACDRLRSCEAACDVTEFQAADPASAAEACRQR